MTQQQKLADRKFLQELENVPPLAPKTVLRQALDSRLAERRIVTAPTTNGKFYRRPSDEMSHNTRDLQRRESLANILRCPNCGNYHYLGDAK